jgi:hypothetical protein
MMKDSSTVAAAPRSLTPSQLKADAEAHKKAAHSIPFAGRLEEIGREIRARVGKLDKVGAQAVDHVDSINHLLSEAEKLCKTPELFKAFKEKLCPDLSRSRTYELLAIKGGRKSLEDIRASTRARVTKHRAGKKAVTDSSSVTTLSGQSIDPSKLGTAAQSQIANASVDSSKAGSAEAEAEAMKAKMAALDAPPIAPAGSLTPEAPPAPESAATEAMIQSAAAKSENERNEITQILDTRLPRLLTVDKQKLFTYIINHPALADMKVPKREKAA